MITGIILLFFSQARAQDSNIQPKSIPSPEIHLETLHTPLPDIVINLTKSKYKIEEEKKAEERKKEEQRLIEEKQKQEADKKRLAELNLIEETKKEELRKQQQKAEEEIKVARKPLETVNKKPTSHPKSKATVIKESIVNNDYCSCVTFAKKQSGINVGPIGVARNHPINTKIPEVGAIGVSAEGKVGHVWIVTSVNQDTITIDEANYKHCQRTTRVLNKNSSIIRGYYTSQK